MLGGAWIILFVAGGYLLGCFSPATLLAKRFARLDIRTVGSGNAGSTNVLRTMGWSMGLLNFLMDCCKGFLPTLLAVLLLREPYALPGGVFTGLAAIVGHVWPVFHRFRGGKGVATLCGALLALQPWYALVLLAFFICVAAHSGYVSLAAITTVTVGSTVSLVLKGMPLVLNFFCISAALLIIYTHRSNLQRLQNGNENRMQFRALRWKQY